MNARSVGSEKERRAAGFLQQRGMVILARNFRCRFGEVDIIAKDEKYLCFIEVKYRTDERFGSPAEAVTYKKQKHICKVSNFYLYSKYKSLDIPIRYDVITISQTDNIMNFRWIKNAFDYI